jgi:protease I
MVAPAELRGSFVVAAAPVLARVFRRMKHEGGNMSDLTNKRVAILATDGFEQSELFEPKKALEEAGAEVIVVSLKPGEIKGWNHTTWGKSIEVGQSVEQADCDEFDALVLPGGVMNPDKLRMNESAVDFVRDFAESGKPIGAICHGPWMLAEAGVITGLRMTSYPSIRTDLINAGAEWVNEEVVVDQGIVTSRKPADIPAFNRKLIEEIREGKHQKRATTHAASATVQ